MDFLSCHVVLWHSWSANIWNSRSCFLIFIRSVQCVSTVLFIHHVKPTLVICHQYNCMYENPAVYYTVLNNLTEKRIHKQSIALSALSADFLPPPPTPTPIWSQHHLHHLFVFFISSVSAISCTCLDDCISAAFFKIAVTLSWIQKHHSSFWSLSLVQCLKRWTIAWCAWVRLIFFSTF